MSRFRVVEILKMKNSKMYGRTLEEELTWRQADKVYKSYQGKRKGKDKLEGTPNLIGQNDKNFVEVEE